MTNKSRSQIRYYICPNTDPRKRSADVRYVHDDYLKSMQICNTDAGAMASGMTSKYKLNLGMTTNTGKRAI